MDVENGVVAVSVDAVMDRLRARAGGFGARKIVGIGRSEVGSVDQLCDALEDLPEIERVSYVNEQAAAPPRKDREGPAVVNGHTRPQADPGGNTGPPPGLSVVGRLRRRFGLGDDPKKRMLLYQRLQLLVDRHGEAVLVLISEAAGGAAGKDREGRWFAKAICAKLAEAGLTLKGGGHGASW